MSFSGPNTFTRTRLTWQAYLTISYYSFLLNSLGPLTPFLISELHLSYTTASFHFSAYALGVIASGLVMGRLVKALSVKSLLWTGVFGLAAGTLLLVLGRHPSVTIFGSFVMGLLGVMISALFSSALAEQHGEYRAVALTESTMMASLFSALAPVAISAFSQTSLTWRAALALMLLAAPVLWFIFGKDRMAPDTSQRYLPSDSIKPKGSLPFEYWRFWFLALLVEAVEFCIIFWAADYLEKVSGFAKPDAVLCVSAFLAAMLIGRWFVSRMLHRSKERRILMVSLLAATAGFLLFWLAPGVSGGLGQGLALLGLILAGLGVAGQFPIVNSLALASAPDHMVEASGRISLAVGLAIFLMPLGLARLADWVGIRLAYGLELGLLVLAIGLVGFGQFTENQS